MKAGSDRGNVYKVERFCIHDGPGIRTLFYFRGCPLACAWCCNPESRDGASTIGDDALLSWKDPVSVDELVQLAARDIVYYRCSGGGVTLTGGEVLTQPAFAAKLLAGLKTRGIHTAIETSGYAPEEAVDLVAPHLDMVLLDIKHMDAERHKALTGHGNERILDNATKLHAMGVPLTIRFPLIPGHNDGAENLHALGRFIRDALPEVRTLHVLGYHNYSLNKYHALGIDYPMGALPPASTVQIANAVDLLRPYVAEVTIGG